MFCSSVSPQSLMTLAVSVAPKPRLDLPAVQPTIPHLTRTTVDNTDTTLSRIDYRGPGALSRDSHVTFQAHKPQEIGLSRCCSALARQCTAGMSVLTDLEPCQTLVGRLDVSPPCSIPVGLRTTFMPFTDYSAALTGRACLPLGSGTMANSGFCAHAQPGFLNLVNQVASTLSAERHTCGLERFFGTLVHWWTSTDLRTEQGDSTCNVPTPPATQPCSNICMRGCAGDCSAWAGSELRVSLLRSEWWTSEKISQPRDFSRLSHSAYVPQLTGRHIFHASSYENV